MLTIKITLIGTTGSVSTEERGYPSMLINEDLLLDCGDGTTHRLVKLRKIDGIKTICISHLHCDHFTGLFSLLWHYWIKKRQESLTLIGPIGIKDTIETIIKLVNTPDTLRSCELVYYELSNDAEKPQEIREIGEYRIKYVRTNHLPPTLAYRIEKKEKSIVYTSDTGPCENLIELSKNCDLLIHESTFPDEFSELAHQLHHSTPSDAAKIATLSNASKLLLNHISFNFQNETEKFRAQAGVIFNKQIIIAKDLMTLEI